MRIGRRHNTTHVNPFTVQPTRVRSIAQSNRKSTDRLGPCPLMATTSDCILAEFREQEHSGPSSFWSNLYRFCDAIKAHQLVIRPRVTSILPVAVWWVYRSRSGSVSVSGRGGTAPEGLPALWSKIWIVRLQTSATWNRGQSRVGSAEKG